MGVWGDDGSGGKRPASRSAAPRDATAVMTSGMPIRVHSLRSVSRRYSETARVSSGEAGRGGDGGGGGGGIPGWSWCDVAVVLLWPVTWRKRGPRRLGWPRAVRVEAGRMYAALFGMDAGRAVRILERSAGRVCGDGGIVSFFSLLSVWVSHSGKTLI